MTHTISIKLYGPDGRKLTHKEVKLSDLVTEKDSKALFDLLVKVAEKSGL